jgi:predicted nucleotidyltransferase
MNKRNELISYALDFVAYLINKVEGIDRVILFGSVARGDFDEESDVDLFIDTKNKKLESKILRGNNNFEKIEKAKRWKLKGVNNPFSCIVGELDSEEWKDLKRGMINNGVILYGKYKAVSERIYQYTLFSFEGIKPESKRVGIYRKLFGFKAGKKRYPGLVEKYDLIKLGKGNIAVPVERALELKTFFRKRKVLVKLYDFWSDYELR